MRRVICVFGLAAFVTYAAAAPLTFSELEFLLRQGVSEPEIIAEAKSRRVVDVPATEQLEALRARGASANLIAALQLPEVRLAPKEVAAYEQLRKSQLERAAVKTAVETPVPKTIPQTVHVAPRGGRPVRQFGHHFVYLRDKSGARPQGDKVFFIVPRSDIEHVRMFILFSNVIDCPRAAAFTARMIALYPKWKERYRDFEVVVVDMAAPSVLGFREFAADHTRWPTAFFLEFDDPLRRAIPRRFPSLLPVSAAGVPLSIKKLGSAEGDLAEVERLLEFGHRR